MTPAIRSYQSCIGQVFSHLGSDRQTIKALAVIHDMVETWNNPDDHDYHKEAEKVPPFPPIWGKETSSTSVKDVILMLLANNPEKFTWRHKLWQEACALEAHSHEIRRCNTLDALASMHKRLKKTETFGAVLHMIITKMLWISSRRGFTVT